MTFRAQLLDLQFADLVAQRLPRHRDVSGNFVFRIIARIAVLDHVFDRLFAGPAERMHAGIDHQPHRALQFSVFQRLQPVDRIVIQAEFVAQAFGIECPALAIGGKPAVTQQIGQAFVLDREHHLEVMARIAFVHVEPDRSAQFAFGRVPPAEIEGARARSVRLAGLVGRGKEELLAIGLVRFDPQLGFGLAQKQRTDLRINLAPDLVPCLLQPFLGLVDRRTAVAALGNRLPPRLIDALDFRQAQPMHLLRGQRQRGHFRDAIGVISLAARGFGGPDGGARLRQIGVRQIGAQTPDRGIERALDRRNQRRARLSFFGFGEAVGQFTQRRVIGIAVLGRGKLRVELLDHQFDGELRQGDALLEPGIEARDYVFHHLRIGCVPGDIVRIVFGRCERHHAAGRGKPRIGSLDTLEMVERQREHGLEHFGLGLGERALLRIAEGVVGDLLARGERRAVDRRQRGDIAHRRRALDLVGRGREIAEAARIGKVAAIERRARVAVEEGSVAFGHQRAQTLAVALRGFDAIAGLRCRGRHRGASDCQRRGELQEGVLHGHVLTAPRPQSRHRSWLRAPAAGYRPC
nr:hypothetical protein [Qipengyuania flava]